MRFIKARSALVLALLGAFVLTNTVQADWFGDDELEVSLEDLIRNAEKYKGKDVVFTAYFNAVGDAHNPYYTQFHKTAYANFAAWPIDAKVYTKRDFQRCYPHFYVNRRMEAYEDMKDLDRFDVVEVTAHVTHIFHGRPHLEVKEIDTVSYGMEVDEIKAAIRAQAHYLAGNYEHATKLFKRAMTDDVPSSVRCDMYRRMGDAQIAGKHYQSALASYKRAQRFAPKSAVLAQNIAACQQAMARGRGDTQAQIAPTKRPAHYLEAIMPDANTGVDAVISALEDETKSREDTLGDRIELARRSVHGVGGAKVRPVSETIDAGTVMETPASEPKVAAAEEEPVTEEVVEEPKAEEVIEEPKAEEVIEEPKAEEVIEEPKAEEVVEEPKAEEVVEAPKAEEVIEEPMAEEVVEEPKAEEVVETMAPEVVVDEAFETDDEMDESDPRMLRVGDTVMRLPRMPFYGCNGVSYESFRAVVEEILDTEDALEIDAFESEMEINEEPSEESPLSELDAEESDEEAMDEDASEEQGQPEAEQGDEPSADEPAPEQPEAQKGEDPVGDPEPEQGDDG